MRCVIIFIKYLYFSKEALIKSDVQITPSDCAKAVQDPVGFQAVFVQYGGKYASKMCFKAYAVIYSEVP